jgi:hypothetical protein
LGEVGNGKMGSYLGILARFRGTKKAKFAMTFAMTWICGAQGWEHAFRFSNSGKR